MIRMYSRRKGAEGSGMLTVRDAFPEMIFGADLYRDDVNKISFILNSYQDYTDAAAAFPDLKAGTWGGAGETALFGDLALKDIGKAYAMDILLDHLNASAEDAIAFGDARVDILMLQHSSVGGPWETAEKRSGRWRIMWRMTWNVTDCGRRFPIWD